MQKWAVFHPISKDTLNFLKFPLYFLYELLAGCKESQFYSLPFVQAVSSMTFVLAHKSFQLVPKPFLISRIDYNPSVIWISPKNSLAHRASSEQNSPAWKQNPLALGYQRRLSLHTD